VAILSSQGERGEKVSNPGEPSEGFAIPYQDIKGGSG